MVSPMSAERVSGIARYARERGWNLMIQDRLGHTPLAWNGDGIIATLRSDPVSFKSIRALMKRGILLVDLTVSRPEVNVPRVTSDHREIGRLAARHFAEREFRHIAWFSSGWGNVHELRYQGLAEAATEKPLKWVVADEITESLAKPIGSPQIAEALALKRTELDRLFRTHLMRSVGAEIRRQRLARVKLLLETTGLPISDIARLTGYCTPSHLTNAFKSAFGLTPKDWRRNRQTQL